jgi:hypothetical protein
MSPIEARRAVGQPDIVEWGRRWQKAWTSHNPKNENENCIGDSFGQLTDEIDRLRAIISRVRHLTAYTDAEWAMGEIREFLEENT